MFVHACGTDRIRPAAEGGARGAALSASGRGRAAGCGTGRAISGAALPPRARHCAPVRHERATLSTPPPTAPDRASGPGVTPTFLILKQTAKGFGICKWLAKTYCDIVQGNDRCEVDAKPASDKLVIRQIFLHLLCFIDNSRICQWSGLYKHVIISL